MRILTTIIVFLSLSAYGAIVRPFTASLANPVFSYTDPLNGSYTATVAGGTGEMAGLATATGSFQNIINPDGTVYVLTVSKASDARRVFTVRSNHLVNLATGKVGATSLGMPTTYTTVSLVIAKAPNRGTYSSKSADSSGTTSAADLGSTAIDLSGSF